MAQVQDSERPRILFVDDEPRVLVALKAMFRFDYEVMTAESGAEALQRLRDIDVDVIVSDQRMPQMTGVEVLRAAREQSPRSIRILLTGYSDLNAVIGAINDGEIFRYVNKPWSNADLRATVAAAIQASRVDHVAAECPPPAAGARTGGVATGILILDEDAAARAMVQHVLGSDYSLYPAASLNEGFDLLERHHIGVMVTELAVGGESVFSVLAAMRQHHPALVVIVLAEQADAARSIDLINHSQIYRFLRKPVGDGLLRGSVNLALRRFEVLQRHPDQAIRIVAQPLPDASPPQGLVERLARMLKRWS